MATRTVATFDGVDDYLSRADEALLSVTSSFYFCCFVKRTGGTNGIIASKSGLPSSDFSWSITHVSGALSFTVSSVGSDGSASTASQGTLTADSWFFVEAQHNPTSSAVAIATTAASASSVSAFTTAAHAGNIYNSAGPFNIGAINGLIPFQGSIHSAYMLDELPTDAERTFLFNEGNGRDYWEFETALKDKVVGAWQLDESSGNRSSKTNSLTLTVNGSAASESRTVNVPACHADVGPAGACRLLLCSCYTWQDWTGLSETGSAARVFINTKADTFTTRPFCLILTDANNVTHTTGRFSSGSLILHFEADLTTGETTDTENAKHAFGNRVGKIVEELQANSEQSGKLFVRSVTLSEPITYSGVNEVGSAYFMCQYKLEYGVE